METDPRSLFLKLPVAAALLSLFLLLVFAAPAAWQRFRPHHAATGGCGPLCSVCKFLPLLGAGDSKGERCWSSKRRRRSDTASAGGIGNISKRQRSRRATRSEQDDEELAAPILDGSYKPEKKICGVLLELDQRRDPLGRLGRTAARDQEKDVGGSREPAINSQSQSWFRCGRNGGRGERRKLWYFEGQDGRWIGFPEMYDSLTFREIEKQTRRPWLWGN